MTFLPPHILRKDFTLMSKPVIILGAGASKDYVSPDVNRRDLSWQPPVTNELFGRNVFDEFLEMYPAIKHLAGDVLSKVPHRMSLEEYLTEIKEHKAATDVNRQKQIVSLGFYLQQLFQRISDKYGKQNINNYNTLIAKINDHGGEACVVNFNYDKLLEQNISDIVDKVDQYVVGAIKVIKIHGACDWVYTLPNMFNEDRETYDFFMQNPWFETMSTNNTPSLSQVFRNLGNNSYKQSYQGRFANFYPAIAIPVTKDKFICPEEHINHLKAALAATNRILIIGWNAGDPHLLELIKQNVNQQTDVTIVSRNSDSAKAISKKMEGIKLLTFIPSEQEGFSNFMRSDEIDKFLAA